MTTQQYANLVSALRRTEGKIDRIEERLAFQFPTVREAREQLDAEVDSILAPGGSLKVFADDGR